MKKLGVHYLSVSKNAECIDEVRHFSSFLAEIIVSYHICVRSIPKLPVDDWNHGKYLPLAVSLCLSLYLCLSVSLSVSVCFCMYIFMYMPVVKFVLYISQSQILTIIINSYDYNNIPERKVTWLWYGLFSLRIPHCTCIIILVIWNDI